MTSCVCLYNYWVCSAVLYTVNCHLVSVCTTTRLVLKVQSGTTLLSAIMCLSVQLLVVLCRYNVAQLEQWARDQKIEDSGNKVVDTLLPVIQVRYLITLAIRWWTQSYRLFR